METFIKNLAKSAGKILKDGFRTKFEINHKTASWDIVTEFDLASEKFVMDKIRAKFPSHGIMSEESGHVLKAKNFWIIDPLDGTRAFSRGLPQFCVSIGFVSSNRIELGAIFDPIHGELFFAKHKRGASLNGKKITVSEVEDLKFSTCALILGTGKTTAAERKFFFDKLVVKYSLWNVKLESAALTAAYTACGRYDSLVMNHLWPWDYAAGALIMKEAGAKVTDQRGKLFRWDDETMVAAPPKLHKKIMNAVKGFHE